MKMISTKRNVEMARLVAEKSRSGYRDDSHFGTGCGSRGIRTLNVRM
jgi:predicted DNA-binding WGR domain protein